jgi:hypothetical protein
MTSASKRALFSATGLAAVLIAGLFIAQAGGDNSDPTPDNSPSPSEATSTPDSSPTPTSPKAQVKLAYIDQWDIYSQAVEELQFKGIGKVFTGKALKVVRKEIEDRRREQTPVVIEVKHDLGIKIIDATTAVVDDRYINRTTDIDPDTGVPTKRYPPDLIHELYTLKKVNDKWKVSAIFRQSIKPAKP